MQQLNAAYAALLHQVRPARQAGIIPERAHTPVSRCSQSECAAHASASSVAGSFRYRSPGRLIAILAALVLLLALALLLVVGLTLVLEAVDQPVLAGTSGGVAAQPQLNLR
jgi:hypothetical protein